MPTCPPVPPGRRTAGATNAFPGTGFRTRGSIKAYRPAASPGTSASRSFLKPLDEEDREAFLERHPALKPDPAGTARVEARKQVREQFCRRGISAYEDRIRMKVLKR